jgi:hypothetical protein
MSGRVLTVAYAGPLEVYVSGWGSRELICEVRNGRPPLYDHRRRAWYCTPKTAADALAMAERRGWTVDVVTEHDMEVIAAAAVAQERDTLW